MVPRLQGTGKSSISSGGLSRSADEEWGGDVEEEEEDAPPELLHRLHSVAACLIQQSWRKQERQRRQSLELEPKHTEPELESLPRQNSTFNIFPIP